jgi:putative transposase
MGTGTMALTELTEKAADIDMLRQMARFMAQHLMKMDVEARCVAGYDEKSPERIRHTRVGSVELRLPSCAKAATSPSSWSRGAPPGRLLTAVIQEAHVRGISTRSVDDLVKALGGMSGVSRNQVSRLSRAGRKRANTSLNRHRQSATATKVLSRSIQGPQGRLAALPRALHSQRAGTGQDAVAHGVVRDRHGAIAHRG